MPTKETYELELEIPVNTDDEIMNVFVYVEYLYTKGAPATRNEPADDPEIELGQVWIKKIDNKRIDSVAADPVTTALAHAEANSEFHRAAMIVQAEWTF